MQQKRLRATGLVGRYCSLARFPHDEASCGGLCFFDAASWRVVYWANADAGMDSSRETSVGSITRLIPGVRTGDELAVAELWRRYVFRVKGVAGPLMRNASPGAGDVDDVTQSAFNAFFAAAADGRAEELGGRDDLWRLLATISRRKAIDRVRSEGRQKRGGNTKADESVSRAAGTGPSPSAEVALQELLESLMKRLDAYSDPRLKTIALLRLEGASTEEIADHLGCTSRTVQRKLLILERLWTEQTP